MHNQSKIKENVINQIQLVGRVGITPETINFESGKIKASFSLAVNETYYSKNEKIEETSWFTIVGWNKIATQIQEKAEKGKKIVVLGKLTIGSYVDKDGNKSCTTEIKAEEIELI